MILKALEGEKMSMKLEVTRVLSVVCIQKNKD